MIIVVQHVHQKRKVNIGVLVDRVLEVLSIQAEQIEPPPAAATDISYSEFILGVGKAEKRVIFLLDIGKVLGGEEALELVHAVA